MEARNNFGKFENPFEKKVNNTSCKARRAVSENRVLRSRTPPSLHFFIYKHNFQ